VRNNERISLYYPVLLKFDCLFFYCFAIITLDMKQKNYFTQNSAFLALPKVAFGKQIFFCHTPANSFAIRCPDFGALRS